MFEKQGKFYADWRDRTGIRKRKAFTTGRAALRHEAEQKEAAHPNAEARKTRWQKSSVRAISLCPTPTPNTKQPRTSSQKPEASHRANSPEQSPQTSMKPSTKLRTRTQQKPSARARSGASSGTYGSTTEHRASTTKSVTTPASGRAASPQNGKK